MFWFLLTYMIKGYNKHVFLKKMHCSIFAKFWAEQDYRINSFTECDDFKASFTHNRANNKEAWTETVSGLDVKG